MKQKDLLELKFWITCNMAEERAKQPLYLEAFEFPGLGYGSSVLEIGTGPHWGVLPLLEEAGRKVGVDPLYVEYWKLGILDAWGDIIRIEEPFELWDTTETFDVIVSANSLDHGDMGFHLLPKISRLLNPGGKFYLHVHLRPAALLNLIHDHALTVEQLDRNLSFTNLIPERRTMLECDVNGWECPTLVGIWQKPR